MLETEIQTLRDAWQKRFEAEQAEADKRRRQAFEAAKRAGDLLRSKYKAQKVFLYGSLAWSKLFNIHSDIDLLVDGYATIGNYWRMVSEVEEIAFPFQPSILLSEDASKNLLEKVYREGIELD
jgi:predicted nucleotidyltransferase